MKHLDVVRAVGLFLNRTPIQGSEAETMAICKQWIVQTEQRLMAAEAQPPAPEGPKSTPEKPGKDRKVK